jgi:hypothetical protein
VFVIGVGGAVANSIIGAWGRTGPKKIAGRQRVHLAAARLYVCAIIKATVTDVTYEAPLVKHGVV